MSQERNDGGFAFPAIGDKNTPDGERYVFNEGMSLRDHFAGMAMVGILNDWTEVVYEAMSTATTTKRINHLAKRSYDIADAMLKAREQ